MHDLLLLIGAFALFAIAAVLADIGASLRALRRRAEGGGGGGGAGLGSWVDFNPARHFLPFSGLVKLPPIAVWVFEKGDWRPLRKCGQPHCKCEPPGGAGEYEGQVVRKECPVCE